MRVDVVPRFPFCPYLYCKIPLVISLLVISLYPFWNVFDDFLNFKFILCLCPGVDLEAAKRLEEEQIMTDARTWLVEGPPADVRHPRTGATPLHVAAAKGYLEALK